MKLKRIFYLLLGLFVLTLTACTQSKKQAAHQITITTSTNVYANIAQNIVGKYGHAQAIITKSNVDPHDFEATSADAKKLAQSQIIVANGLGYDDWMNKLASSVNKKPVVVSQLMNLSTGSNPHLWYNLTMPRKYVDCLVKKLSKLEPKHAAYFKENGQKYLAKVAAIQKLAQQVNGQKQKPVYVSEPVFDYALKEAGFKIGNVDFEKAIQNGTDPSPKTINEMTSAIKRRKISFFVNNVQASSSTVNNFIKLAKKNQIPVLNVRETIPNNLSYIKWMTDNYQNLAKVAESRD